MCPSTGLFDVLIPEMINLRKSFSAPKLDKPPRPGVKAAVFLGVGRSLRSVPRCMSGAGFFFPQTRLTFSHVQGTGREAPRWLGRGPWKFRWRGDGSTLLRTPACLPGSWERLGDWQWVGSGGPQPHPGPSPWTAGGRWRCGSWGGAPAPRSASNTGSIAPGRLCPVPGTLPCLPPRGATSWGPAGSHRMLVSPWCLQALCFPG